VLLTKPHNSQPKRWQAYNPCTPEFGLVISTKLRACHGVRLTLKKGLFMFRTEFSGNFIRFTQKTSQFAAKTLASVQPMHAGVWACYFNQASSLSRSTFDVEKGTVHVSN